MAGNDGDRDREGAGTLADMGHQRPGALIAGARGEHQDADVRVLVDQLENLFGGDALADHALGHERGTLLHPLGVFVERLVGGFRRFRHHDVGDAEPLLITLARLDDTQRDDLRLGASGAFGGPIDRAVAFLGVVDHDQIFALVAFFVAAALGAHEGLPRRSHLWRDTRRTSREWLHGGRAADKRELDRLLRSAMRCEKTYRRTKPTTSLTAFMVSAAIICARSEPSASTESIYTGSCTRRFISAPIGPSLATARSASALLKVENCPPPNSDSTCALLTLLSAA